LIKQIKKIGNATLYCADCDAVVKSLVDKSIDIVVSSPPYNIGREYGLYQDRKIDYMEWQISFWNFMFNKMKDNGHVFLNIQPSRKNPLWCYELVSQLDWKIQNTFIWNKRIEIDGYVRGQGTTSQSKKYICNGWEYVFHLTKKGETEISQKQSGVSYHPQWAEENAKRFGKTWRPTVNSWHIPYETIGHGSINKQFMKGKHPAIFPKSLVEKCIKVSGCKQGVVFDPFMGTGTTCLVAQDMGLNSVGVEIDSNYYEFACDKLQELF
jgi:site-specific DNA-methyltransferase (adenine-specific)